MPIPTRHRNRLRDFRVKGLRRTSYDGEIFRLALPALGTLAADPLVTLVDTAYVGRLGAKSLASLGIAAAIFGIAFAIANCLPYGVTPLTAAAAGSGDEVRAGRVARGAIFIAVVAGLIVMVILLLTAAPTARLLGASADLIDGTVTYIRIRSTALPAVLLVLAAHGIYRGHQDTRTPLVVSVGVSVLNLILDPIMIFGANLGLAGAAWATVVAQWAGALTFVVLMARRDRQHLKLTIGRGFSLRPLFSAGAALFVRVSSLIVTFSVATAVAARLGTAAVAGHHVAYQLWLFLSLVVDALAIAAQARIGAYLGAGEGERAKEISDRLLGMGLIFGTGLGIALGIAAPWVPRWFSSDPEVVAAAGAVYVFVAVSQPLNAVLFVWDGIAIGAQAFAYLAWSSLVAGVLGVSVLLLVLPLGLGLTGVWWALLIFMLVRSSALAWWYVAGPLGRGGGLEFPEV